MVVTIGYKHSAGGGVGVEVPSHAMVNLTLDMRMLVSRAAIGSQNVEQPLYHSRAVLTACGQWAAPTWRAPDSACLLHAFGV